MEFNLLHPDPIREQEKHKLKRLVQGPNAYYLDVKCKQCNTITVAYSHATMPVKCLGCGTTVAVPNGGNSRISF
eukprot:gnl/Chilomastix_caulleri/8634.p1 GENE.gnl/Chilomastix_caulleri/8634~~gnl/Chilomastix_caulleri/8634.p1  ORF type:complete len:74 (+),score=7.64 gnl/Chilomastix_caulleri/8634:31-252(+)